MKTSIVVLLVTLLILGCEKSKSKLEIENEIIQVERNFQKMSVEKGIPEAFYFFADSKAIIKRQNDTLIAGNENIKLYYQKQDLKNVKVDWKPDFVDVSSSGDMAYTYGKYVWKFPDSTGLIKKYEGIFHTVWKKQKDGSWKYVWD